jgi:CheY-like chemotaxis protein
LAAEVKVELLRKGWRVEVFAEGGHVIVGINDPVMSIKRLQPKIGRLAKTIAGVDEVTVKLGSHYSPPSVNPWDGIQAPPKILLVDDEKEFVHTLSERLKTRNIGSSIAYNGEQALEMLKSETVDVIVLDLMMPGIDGIETLRRVKKHYPGVEVIILTGHGSKREQDIAEELGAFAYLQKPVNVNELARVMKAAYLRAKGEE